jgi:hypothetical protein
VGTGGVSKILKYARDEAVESGARDVSGYLFLRGASLLTLKPSSTRVNIIWIKRPGAGRETP